MDDFHLLAQKNLDNAKVAAHSSINKIEAWTFYHAMYIPSITYPLPLSNLTNAQCECLDREMKQAILPRCGYNRNTPNAVVYGPTELAGIELRSLPLEKGAAQLQSLVLCLCTGGVPRDLANVAIAWAQYLVGTRISLFLDTTTPLPHLNPMTWIPPIRSFLKTFGGKLELEQTFLPKLQRKRNSFIMDNMSQENFSSTEMQKINACRLYLRVTLVSDIVLSNGRSIQETVVRGDKCLMSSYRGLKPYQDQPSQATWQLWKRALGKMIKGRSRDLISPLGKWLIGGDDTFRQWNFYLHDRCIYE